MTTEKLIIKLAEKYGLITCDGACNCVLGEHIQDELSLIEQNIKQEERSKVLSEVKVELDAIVKTAVLELHNETTILNNVQKLSILLEKKVFGKWNHLKKNFRVYIN